MPSTPFTLESRLPQVGTNIFSVMSKLATECGAINLSQGFPDFQADPALLDAVTRAMQQGKNQYAPMPGLPELRQAIATKISALHGTDYDPESEITVTAGATQALFTAITTLVHPGDEVIVFEPVYDCYIPAIELAGGRAVLARLHFPDYAPDWDQVRQLITPKTRMIIINSPHNPTGSLLSRADLDQLAGLIDATNIILLADEVYEHMVFDGETHASAAAHPLLRERAVIVSSFGKTYHVTGWKIGTVVAPALLMQEFRKVHQFNVFCVNTPAQVALSEYLQDSRHYLELSAFYQSRRDFFQREVLETPFEWLPSRGTYFQLARYGRISSRPDREFAEWLTREAGVAVIPVSAFYQDGHDDHVVRFCFAKQESTLSAAGQ
ncbi:MAG: pyridoxal phosphate-dependent aminotransferase, partial [Proteobacteria bacterium]|nr:pyridoxal phosphate-dependent aminotransferase [Pseudomonadota bacterium]